MATKTFIEKKGLKLVGDERDIMVSNSLIADVIKWCDDMNIGAEQVDVSPITQWSFGVNLWRIKNEQQRLMFALRWS
jgi:hypothetical protein